MNTTETDQNDFWQSHSLKFLEMAFRYDYRERLSKPDGYGKNTGDCGDTVEFFILADGDNIKTLSYDIQGCMNTNACANAIIDLADGKNLEQAWEIKPETVSDYLETLPEDHFHCAELAVGALYKALSQARDVRKAPWKKAYYS